MDTRLIWDEAKRRRNFAKHGFDFADAGKVLESRFRMDAKVMRGAELRTVSISYVLGFLAVLTMVHTNHDDGVRIISFRRASRIERENYYAWIENECDEP